MLKGTVKLGALALSLSMITSGCALADWAKNSTTNQTVSSIDMSKLSPEERAKLEAEIKEDQARLAAEKQAMLEMSLIHEIGEQHLQFKPLLAKLYAEHRYALLWQDKAAEKQFLREYAAMVASGISKRSAQSLEQLSQAEQTGGLTYDVLLSDAFLDYLYYSTNINQQAQRWLYSSNSYKAQQPADEQIQHWLSAVKNQELLAYVKGLSTQNTHYQQTIQALSSMISASGITPTGKKLAVNAQRLRVIPDFYNGIFVNIPSYQLQYYRDGRLVLESRVIVGKNERRTPVMYSKLSNVVVNPPWNAPTRLVNEDIVPKLKRDPGYAAAHGYSILDSKGNAIDPYSINWNTIGKNFPYRIRQAPGDSALGNYKFNMPSSDAIYLHDTPNHGLFSRKDRALSSGCVRVEKSSQLAGILLKEAGWSDERKKNVLASKKTTSANVRSDNPVFLYYVTAWVDNGQTKVLPDIYKYDSAVGNNEINWNTVKKYL
ncbi:L,D-transpeptidase family protein [Rodentibacter trehalosifermentans]|uniref:L,D-transpeptidase n=1 Tax=Rodentibacter trehalosifermentans TaxID=1908263 RepID=A0A1V3J116_9PAST|nr:L,D-transpeptidase family protein [Rodentibacter trehalosifermentans]OOF48227.1 L,D-transpeptidase [Rodentibacter trehalosifermentans]OOF52297.1 L,D-transpeptidase [Rodentibacter trehalosifermentans]